MLEPEKGPFGLESVHHCRGEVLPGFIMRAVACLPVVVTGGAPTISVRRGETQDLSSDLAHVHLGGEEGILQHFA